jgi:hypothetical protein
MKGTRVQKLLGKGERKMQKKGWGNPKGEKKTLPRMNMKEERYPGLSRDKDRAREGERLSKG